jgi:acyl dehydratase
MGINPEARGISIGPKRRAWKDRDTLLYALGVGAGLDDLSLVTENSHDLPQQVLPTYAVIVAEGNALLGKIGKVNWGKMVHGAQGFRVFRPLAPKGEIEVTASITDLQDKGEGGNAVMTITAEACDPESGDRVAETTTTLVFRGAGGFGGEPGEARHQVEIPDRAPDTEVTYTVREDQALIYRLSGDRNPLHSDPWFATERAGFPRPILHGLCTYGFAGRALVEGLCAGDTSRLTSMHARFAAPVFPGESLRTSMWTVDERRAVFTVTAEGGDGQPERIVLDSGEAEVR